MSFVYFVEVKTGAFVRLFSDLDCCLDKLGLLSYGICDTTLEEVFLKVADATGMWMQSFHSFNSSCQLVEIYLNGCFYR